MIPRHVFGVDVDPSARLLLALLWTWAPSDPYTVRPFVWPSIELLARHLRCTERSLRRSLQTLREAGLVVPAVQSVTWRPPGTLAARTLD